MLMNEALFEGQIIGGRELLQICVGLYQLILHFDEGLTISSESGVYLTTGDEIIQISPPVENVSNLLGLLGAKIKQLSIDASNQTRVVFEDGHVLEFRAENDGYESYEINIGDESFVYS